MNDLPSPDLHRPRYTDDEEDSGADSMSEAPLPQGYHWGAMVPHPSYTCPPYSCTSCLYQPQNMQVLHACRLPCHLARYNKQHPQVVATPPFQLRHQHACREAVSGGHTGQCGGALAGPGGGQGPAPHAGHPQYSLCHACSQVATLSDQIHNQTDKIVELEKTLDGKKEDLRQTENMLQIEMMNRSSLETTKLELLSEVSGLKLRQVRVPALTFSNLKRHPH